MRCRSTFCSYAPKHLSEPLGGGFGSRLAPSTRTGQHVDVGSAGVFAVDGSEPSPEVAALLASRGISEVGRVRILDFRNVAGASVVFAMTAAHAEAAQHFRDAPGPPIQTLDPAGDVPDPIGHGFGVYADLADRLDAVLDQVLKEVTHANNDLG